MTDTLRRRIAASRKGARSRRAFLERQAEREAREREENVPRRTSEEPKK